MLRQFITLPDHKGEIILMDSISLVQESDKDWVVVSGSHGGVPSAEYALRVHLKGVIFNDAGIGKEEAGIKSLTMLNEIRMMAAAADCNTAKIGDANDVFENGIISSANNTAQEKGIKPGMTVKQAINVMIS